ncbi:MAG: hypothetical protein IJ796_01770 [Lachnospiraceae bacterium]|nr:hypothetical protein [Lachnospiraceae bacterium]
MKDFHTLLEECSDRNEIVSRYADSNVTICEHLGMVRDIAEKNRGFQFLNNGEDLAKLAADHADRLLGGETGAEIYDALRFRVIHTADHHGGIYSSQGFQGDLLYGELLKQMGYRGKHTPLFSGSHVELGNSTYARGICCYGSPDGRQVLPLRRKLDINRMVAVTAGYDGELIRRMENRLGKDSEAGIFSREQTELLKSIIDRIYKDPEILSRERYADQITLIGERLSGEIFSDTDSRRLVYIEVEEPVRKLMEKELKDDSTMLWHLFYDPAVLKALNSEISEEGIPLSCMLLRGADAKGRRINTIVNETGGIEGIDHGGNHLGYPSDPDSLIALLEERKLIPYGLSTAAVLCFERGYTWTGGYFQALYLPKWAKLCERIFRASGLEGFADCCAAYDGSSYLCGPVYALNDTGSGTAVCAGPLEFIQKKPSEKAFESWLSTSMGDAHRMGLFETYLDLVPADSKDNSWYRAVAGYCGEHYKEHFL